MNTVRKQCSGFLKWYSTRYLLLWKFTRNRKEHSTWFVCPSFLSPSLFCVDAFCPFCRKVVLLASWWSSVRLTGWARGVWMSWRPDFLHVRFGWLQNLLSLSPSFSLFSSLFPSFLWKWTKTILEWVKSWKSCQRPHGLFSHYIYHLPLTPRYYLTLLVSLWKCCWHWEALLIVQYENLWKLALF